MRGLILVAVLGRTHGADMGGVVRAVGSAVGLTGAASPPPPPQLSPPPGLPRGESGPPEHNVPGWVGPFCLTFALLVMCAPFDPNHPPA